MLFKALSARSLSEMFANYQLSLNRDKDLKASEEFYKYFSPECRNTENFDWSVAECFVLEQYNLKSGPFAK